MNTKNKTDAQKLATEIIASLTRKELDAILAFLATPNSPQEFSSDTTSLILKALCIQNIEPNNIPTQIGIANILRNNNIINSLFRLSLTEGGVGSPSSNIIVTQDGIKCIVTGVKESKESTYKRKITETISCAIVRFYSFRDIINSTRAGAISQLINLFAACVELPSSTGKTGVLKPIKVGTTPRQQTGTWSASGLSASRPATTSQFRQQLMRASLGFSNIPASMPTRIDRTVTMEGVILP